MIYRSGMSPAEAAKFIEENGPEAYLEKVDVDGPESAEAHAERIRKELKEAEEKASAEADEAEEDTDDDTG